MNLLVDGVFFQLASTGIARIWSSILPLLASYPNVNVILLDRGGSPSIQSVQLVEFPSYAFSHTAADSFLIDQVCREFDIDVFTSTYYTTPVSVPSVLLIYDMIPEVLGFDLSSRAWQEKQIAISFASSYACISKNTLSDLQRFYPSIKLDRAVVTYCGVDHEQFRPRDRAAIQDFKRRWGITKPYFMLVGSREQHLGYKNADLLFTAVRKYQGPEIEILCCGGEPEINPTAMTGLPKKISARRVDLSDEDLACAYSGAEALVYPSRYEGFGMPVAEAMACGCPIITTRYGSLAEVAGDAPLFISGKDADELRSAMLSVREASVRRKLIEAGLLQASRYNWDEMARGIHELFRKALAERDDPSMKNFFAEWQRLRAIQAEVDVGV